MASVGGMKARRPSRSQLIAARGRTIRDVVRPRLDVLFCGINPGLYSGATGYHFARPGNRFWPALHLSGFTARQLAPWNSRDLLEAGCGITNLVSRTTAMAAELSVDVTPGSPGSMTFHLEVSSPNLAAPLVIPFTYVTDDAGVLIVDDDGSEDYEGYFTAALDSLGWSYGVWDRAAGKLPDEVLQAYPLLIWQVGECYPTLDAEDRSFLAQHLDAGGSLLLTGQDIGWDLNDWLSINTDPEFFETYLHATYSRHATNIVNLDGIAGDPITGGLSLHIAGGDGADNQELQDEIARRGADATAILGYRGDGVAAIRAADSASGARVVYLSFGFEAIDNAQDRADLLGRALEWLSTDGLLYRRPAGRRLPGGPTATGKVP